MNDNHLNYGNCPVCNSKMRDLIENLANQGLNSQKIFDYLKTLKDPDDRKIVIIENLKPSQIKRHIQNHFNPSENVAVKTSATQRKIQKTRNNYATGQQIFIDKINAMAMQIDIALTNMQELDSIQDQKLKHDLYIKYFNATKGMIETLAKLTGDLKQEGTIDINFFSNEVTKFAELTLLAIRRTDKSLNLNGTLELSFSQEFEKLWDNYIKLQKQKINKEIPITNDTQTTNTFNDSDI